MASNGMRQLGEPRINICAYRQKPIPFHLEVNNWEHNLLYMQCVQRIVVDKLVGVLKITISKGGCGLKNIGENILEHYNCEKTRFNKLSNRLIGSQAIILAKYGMRAFDVLVTRFLNPSDI